MVMGSLNSPEVIMNREGNFCPTPQIADTDPSRVKPLWKYVLGIVQLKNLTWSSFKFDS